jgi:UDP-3-O-[3-hydroxymyristoyl] glucosamine N-acyltransferase
MAYTLQELADLTQSTVVGDFSHVITGVETLESASSSEASFCTNPRYISLLKTTKAGVVCVDSNFPHLSALNYLVSDDPKSTFQFLIKLFLHKEINRSSFIGIHPTAVIHPSAQLGLNLTIGPHVVIDQGCFIGDNTTILSNTVVSYGVTLGADCLLYPNVTVREHCYIGNRVILQSGVVIGSCGYGYTTNKNGQHQKQEQLGIVVVEDDVEIGANTTVDRARFKETRIKSGTKIDNLVQIAHNVILGSDNLIVAQTGIAGSVKTGSRVIIGGQSGTVGHIEICSDTMLAARSGVTKSISQPGKYRGTPAIALNAYNREQVYIRRIEGYAQRIQALEDKLMKLEKDKKI